ncbi:hypothetical protein [Chitinophaga sp. Cy-1792]|uniref:hypothetical protein n=1 Tax=Chitinophaga sp. Cy-1792 TaxID=2608339 RepID=UPI00141ECB36|nr:hypothetical protein [Chitinophaga sp. Cy-1792]NIG55380.1 hypothetical protein [Chitinophaga sp. Cy-1792]
MPPRGDTQVTVIQTTSTARHQHTERIIVVCAENDQVVMINAAAIERDSTLTIRYRCLDVA